VVQGARKGFVIAIRGFGSDLPPGIGESAVSTNFDGVYNFRAEAGTFGYYDLERVEVLRGPQGTLYGRNATGGVVNVITKDPTDEVGGYGTVEVGSDKLLRLEGAVNVPVNDDVAARLAFVSIDRDGFISNGMDDAQGSAARAKVRYQPAEDVKMVFSAEMVKLGGNGPGSVLLEDFNDGEYYSDLVEYQSQNYDSYKFSANVEFAAGPGVVTFIPSYQYADGEVWGQMMVTEDIGKSLDPKDVKQTSAELRYSAQADSDIQWVAGLYYYDLHNQNQNLAQGGGVNHDYTTAYAAFGQITYPVTDAFRMIAGARLSYDEKSYGVDSAIAAETDWTTFDWKAGLEMDLADDVLTYLTLASGHRPGGFNSMPGATSVTFDPEELVSAELGVKSRFMGGRMQVNSDVFYYDYSDFQVSDFYFPEGSFEPESQLLNVEAVTNYGAELETEIMLTVNTIATFSATYLHSRYDADFVLHDGPFFYNMNGEQMPHAPDWTLKGGLEHSFVLTDGAAITPNFTIRWTDDQYVAPLTNEEQFQESYTMVDANIRYVASSGDWSVNAYVKNATDEMVKNAYFVGEVMVGSPRQFGVVVNAKF
jgi:iron complex outermembrane receptor protein